MNRIQVLPAPPAGILPSPDYFLRHAIPKEWVPFIAKQFYVHQDTVRRWRRPLPTGAPLTGTGARSPLGAGCDVVRFIASYDLKAAGRVAIYPSLYYQALVDTLDEGFVDERERAQANAKLLKEATDAINEMSINGITPKTLEEQIELRDMASLMIARTFATMMRRAA